jgi:superfamily II DNA helicase RecQ
VFSNATLEAIAVLQPSTLEQLGEVSGIGPSRIDKYGEAILGAVKG